MASPWIAALIALFLWWFSTGAILVVVKRADRKGASALKSLVWAALPLFGVGFWLFFETLNSESAASAYLGFLSALAIWGWIELAFLTGVIAGPMQKPCPPGVRGWERFLRAWGTVAFHEILLTVALAVIVLYGRDGANSVGVWTYIVLYFARVSAKLNLFLGVPKINTDFLPHALSHLPSHFRIAPLNWLFPISVTALSFAVACWLERLYHADTAHSGVGFALLAAITTLALIEHWLMVLPLPDERLWKWMLPTQETLPKPNSRPPTRHEDAAHGL
ncbi:MAG: putative photosynthetic complex assembly protein PuhE [Pseudomonadota bacterium]